MGKQNRSPTGGQYNLGSCLVDLQLRKRPHRNPSLHHALRNRLCVGALDLSGTAQEGLLDGPLVASDLAVLE